LFGGFFYVDIESDRIILHENKSKTIRIRSGLFTGRWQLFTLYNAEGGGLLQAENQSESKEVLK